MQPARLPPRSSITPGQTITVQGSQTVYAVARKNNVSMRDLIVLNDLRPPFSIHAGQRLVLPAGRNGGNDFDAAPSFAPAPLAASPTAVESTTLPVIETKSLPPVNIKPQATQVDTLNAPSPVTKPVSTTVQPVQPEIAAPEKPTETPTTDISFKWPVQGPILSSYGPKGSGLNNDGVNIGAPKGAPVQAAANGIVVYAGNEMKGFGNLVLIRHQGGWVTAYAHLDRALVAKDAVVAQGDMIGTVGKTGNVSTPQLHFETRYRSKPVDPAGLVKG
jgi:murein DD-endopeptidase MepM/ murein hydrolase activator NlpD